MDIFDIISYTLWYRLIGFIGVVQSPENFKDNYNSLFVKINKYINITPISFMILHNKHYSTVYINDKYVHYYDSFGNPPPEEYLDLINKFAKTIKNKSMSLIYNKT